MSATARALKAFPSLVRVGFAEMVAYRAEVVIWILTASVPLLMLAVFDRIADDGPVAGFRRADFAGYFVAVLVIRQLTSAWIVWELNYQIRNGSLSPALLKPVHPLAWFAASTLATIPFRLIVLAPLVTLLWLWRPEMHFTTDVLNWLVIAPSLLLAWAMNFSVQTSFGCLAFWLGQSIGVFNIWFGLWSLFSGYIVPVELLPSWIGDIAAVAPFRALLGIPVEIITGRLVGAHVLEAIGLQLLWLVVIVAITRVAWTRGVRKYEAYGA